MCTASEASRPGRPTTWRWRLTTTPGPPAASTPSPASTPRASRPTREAAWPGSSRVWASGQLSPSSSLCSVSSSPPWESVFVSGKVSKIISNPISKVLGENFFTFCLLCGELIILWSRYIPFPPVKWDELFLFNKENIFQSKSPRDRVVMMRCPSQPRWKTDTIYLNNNSMRPCSGRPQPWHLSPADTKWIQ